MSPAADLTIAKRTGAVTWVQSGERRYRVDPNRLRCTCPGAVGGRICRHLRFVVDYLEGR